MSVARKHMKTAHHVKDLDLAPKGHAASSAGRSMPVLATSASGSPSRSAQGLARQRLSFT